LALDKLAEEENIRVNRLRFKSLTGDGRVAGERVLLLKPQTFMNNSGEAVREALSFYKLPAERLLVLYDDISLPCGRLRVRPKGSDGGHNGIKSILSHVGSDEFPRVKIGVGSPPRADYDLVDWVLGSIPPSESEAYHNALSNAVLACREIIKNGCDSAMNLYNSK
jgi:PTH1 family peptidyl-tRNA hydrolase